MAGTWVIALITGRTGAVIVTGVLFAAVIGGYLVGLIPENAAGTIYMMMLLAAMGFVPAAASGRLTLANVFAGVELVIAWAPTFNRPIVYAWLQTLLAPLVALTGITRRRGAARGSRGCSSRSARGSSG